MVRSSMMATYELWEMRSGNLVGSWSAENEALAIVRDALDRHGDELATSLSLLVEDSQGETTVVAEGSALLERARRTPYSSEQRSA
jgi:hypothetical protein